MSEKKRQTHNIRLNGVHGFVSAVKNGGKQITVYGWNRDHWRYREHDWFILHMEDGKTTRYRAVKVTHFGDPPDMYLLECRFAPRKPRLVSTPTEAGDGPHDHDSA